jgi:hypothetical protein
MVAPAANNADAKIGREPKAGASHDLAGKLACDQIDKRK